MSNQKDTTANSTPLVESGASRESTAEDQNDAKQRRDWALLQRYFSYVKPYWLWITVGLLSIPFSVGATLLMPWLIIHIVDDYLTLGRTEGLPTLIWGLGGSVFLGYVADAIYSYSLQRAGQQAISDMRQDLFAHILTLPRNFFDHHPVGLILTRVTSDMEALGESLATGVLAIFTDIVKTLALFIFLFYLSWQLTLVILIILPIIYLISNFLRSKLRHYYNLTREALADSTGFLQECLNGMKTIQLYAAEKKVIKRYEAKTSRFLKAQTHSNFYDAALFSIIDGITSISLGLMIWYGAQRILSGSVTLGILIGFINTLNKIFIPIREFTQQISAIQRALAAMEHINGLFLEKPEATHIQESTEDDFQFENFESLVFDNVYFRYSESGPYILKGVSFTLKKGDRLAIVGTTGSGKSTIVRLVTKTYTNYQGSIKLNGQELSNIPRKPLQALITMMQQDVYLFNESIGFNIALNRSGIDEEATKQAAEYVYANEFIERLPEAYQFRILENGKNLSAGEAQLVSFARAIAGKNEVIILDEATSSVDSVTEHWIEMATEKIFKEKTVIAIAHRLSTIRNSDTILVLQEGNVVEKGSHDQLMEQSGIYANLVKNLVESTES